ncbi:PilZ domain-containing protein [Solemya velesiana gill symbiont]|uniref:Cyclic diguanosine monophosphate-binding protein n=1 Tax=Solemya velesiana gill symbiont TaxID=1918948 RepID=A0A1T2KVX5_9GAMM|nr:PilZ domain-containing protein [Solemya velesiana gill symbiont]OOZ37008.1 hypothetical protein BOW51_04545 [Solemya velesiana gill symbiont]
MTSEQIEERRNFTRLLFDAPVIISYQDQTTESRLIDISLKGALVARSENYAIDTDAPVTLEISLPGSEIRIRMPTLLAHTQNNSMGFRCTHIDMESVGHLRRLIELNLGEPDLLERELAALG